VYGRSVLVYRDADIAGVHQSYESPALLFRAGGYWLHETGTWYRPSQVWDAPSQDYYNRVVPAAITVTAADLVDGTGDPGRASLLTIADVDADAPALDRWEDHLALWAEFRPPGANLGRCIVNLAAPELTGDQLVGVAELARAAGIAPSTLRAYIARGEADVPEPQATVSGRSAWARPVVYEWAEQRRRDPDGLVQAVTSGDGEDLAPGAEILRARIERMLMRVLWEGPYRQRWSMRWRGREPIREVADDLSRLLTTDLLGSGFVNMNNLSQTLIHALLDELAYSRDLHRPLNGPDNAEDPEYYGIARSIEEMLRWFIACDPSRASAVISEVIGDAERRLGIPRTVIEQSLRVAATPNKAVGAAGMREFLARVLSPGSGSRDLSERC